MQGIALTCLPIDCACSSCCSPLAILSGVLLCTVLGPFPLGCMWLLPFFPSFLIVLKVRSPVLWQQHFAQHRATYPDRVPIFTYESKSAYSVGSAMVCGDLPFLVAFLFSSPSFLLNWEPSLVLWVMPSFVVYLEPSLILTP